MSNSIHLLDDHKVGGVSTNLRKLCVADPNWHGSHKVALVNPQQPRAAEYFATQTIVVHFSIAWAKLPYLIALRLKNPAARMILQEHHYSPEHFENATGALRRFGCLAKCVAALFDRILAVSEAQALWYRQIGIKVHAVVPPMAPVESLLSLPQRPLSQKPVVGIAGRLDRKKGIDLALELLESHQARNFQFVFAGYGELEHAVVAATRRFNNVRFVGQYSDPAEYLSLCDAVLIPSRLDTYGLAALEAKAAARPIVVAQTCGLPAQASGCGVTVARGCAHSLATGLQQLFQTNKVLALGRAARASAETHNATALQLWTHEFSGALPRGR